MAGTTAKEAESGATASGSESGKKSKPKAETFTTRHAANKAFFALSADARADVKVARDDKTGLFSIQPRGK